MRASVFAVSWIKIWNWVVCSDVCSGKLEVSRCFLGFSLSPIIINLSHIYIRLFLHLTDCLCALHITKKVLYTFTKWIIVYQHVLHAGKVRFLKTVKKKQNALIGYALSIQNFGLFSTVLEAIICIFYFDYVLTWILMLVCKRHFFSWLMKWARMSSRSLHFIMVLLVSCVYSFAFRVWYVLVVSIGLRMIPLICYGSCYQGAFSLIKDLSTCC